MSKPIVAGTKPTKVELEEGKTYAWCHCGRSEEQPFCDRSHKGSEMMPYIFTAEKSGPAFMCMCKKTGNMPFCDGSHKDLSEDDVGKEA